MSENQKPRGRFKADIKFIFDGDTFNIKSHESGDEYRVRLYGLDAPERGQEYGGIVQYLLQKKLHGKEVEVEFTQTAHKGREVAVIWVDGKNLNLQMIEEGLAWKALQFNDKYHDSFFRAHQNAKRDQLGLWSRPNPEEPYKYRNRINLEDEEHYKKAVIRDNHEVAEYKVALENATPNLKKYKAVKASEFKNIETFKSDFGFANIFDVVKKSKLSNMLDGVKDKMKEFKVAVRKIKHEPDEHEPIYVTTKKEPNISVNEAMRNKRNQLKP